MTNTYNTGNPLGSTDARDLYDNASNMDEGMNSGTPSFTDRLGVLRKTWNGLETEFDLAQSGRETEFQQFLTDSGFTSLGNYAAGMNFTLYNQYMARDGFFYRPAPSSIPFTTTGTWVGGDENLFNLFSADDVLRADLANDTDPSKGAGQVGLAPSRAGEVGRTVSDAAGEVVSAKAFGCACDGHLGAAATDDSAALQAAIDYCLSLSPPAILEIPGLCRLDSPVLIERLVDAPENSTYFTIRGSGDGGGFYAHFGVTMFDAFPASANWFPESQKVRFEGLSFISLAPTNPTWAIEGRRFLAVDFTNCSFYRMRAARNETYYQTWYFNNCSAYGYVGTFLQGTGGSYDVHFSMSKFQAGTRVIDITQNQAHGLDRTNFYVSQCHLQAMSEAAITADAISSVVVSENYFEFVQNSCNFATANNLSNLSPNNVVAIYGNLFAPTVFNREDPLYFDILWGRTAKGLATGNYVTGATVEGMGTKLHKIEAGGISNVCLIHEPGFSGIHSSEGVSANLGFIQPGSNEALVTVRGRVSGAGAIAGGLGFTVVKTGTGTYQINFTRAFSNVPSGVATSLDSAGSALSVMDNGAGTTSSITFTIRSGATLTDSGFSFIVCGTA